MNLANYENKPVIIKGCYQGAFAEFMYSEMTHRLLPKVRSLMYGEACSAVPVYKKRAAVSDR